MGPTSSGRSTTAAARRRRISSSCFSLTEAVLTSPYVRCVDTVVPLAEARGLALQSRHELSEEWHATQGVALVRELAGRDVVVCGHGGLEDAVPGAPRWKKGTVFVLGPSLELLDAFRA
jgi:phosphohistidine phosphatase SixA